MTEFTRPWSDLRLREGDEYLVSRRPEGVTAGSSSDLVIENTSSTLPIYIKSVTFKNNQGKGYIDTTRDFTIDTNGTSVPVNDLRIDGTNEIAGLNAEFGGTYTGGTTFDLDLAEGSTSPSTSGRFSAGTDISAFLIAPGSAIRFVVHNESGNTTDQLLRAVVVQPDE